MRNLKYVFVAAAIGGLMTLPQTSSATPLASGLGIPGNGVIADDLVQKVHGWHCGKRKGWYHGHRAWHRHRRACYERRYYDDDYDDYSYGYPSYGYAYPYPFFFGFNFGDDGGRRGHHRRRRGGDD